MAHTEVWTPWQGGNHHLVCTPPSKSSDPIVTCGTRSPPFVPQSEDQLGNSQGEQNCPNQIAKLSFPGMGLYLPHKGEEFGVWS